MKTLFPHTLNRFEYLVRLLIFSVALYGIAYIFGLFGRVPRTTPVWIPVVVMSAGFICRFVCFDIPRCRSLKWSPWVVLWLVPPIADAIMQLLLLIIPSKLPPNTSLEPTGVGAGSSAPRSTSPVAGGSVLGR
jgi:hypothetical protein